MAQYTFDLPNMTCSGCLRGVTAAVQEVDAGATVTADLDARRAVVESSADEAALYAALDEAGFTA